MAEAARRVWLVDDDATIRWVLEKALRTGGMIPRSFEAAEPALKALRAELPDVLVADIRMPGRSGLDLLREVHQTCPDLPIILMTAFSDLHTAVTAYSLGAFEYLIKPLDLDRAVSLIKRAAAPAAQPVVKSSAPAPFAELCGRSPAMQDVFRAIGRLARSSASALITGEHGTGKEAVARAVHDHSQRASGPFVVLHTTAVPPDMVERELFGSETGIPGDDTAEKGGLELADSGTLFIEEIGELAVSVQARLLKAMATGLFYRAGGHSPLHSAARVIVATADNLRDLLAQGRLRRDLYHRINSIHIDLPPLRARTEDVPDLLDRYLTECAEELRTIPKTVSKEAAARLAAYSWPGNVTELVNVCRALTILSPGREIRLEDLPAKITSDPGSPSANTDWLHALALWIDRHIGMTERPLVNELQPAFERVLICRALRHTQGHQAMAAKLLGWARNTLATKMRDLGINASGTSVNP
jgi:two-component system nitrogen regulation response regulator GlnG